MHTIVVRRHNEPVTVDRDHAGSSICLNTQALSLLFNIHVLCRGWALLHRHTCPGIPSILCASGWDS